MISQSLLDMVTQEPCWHGLRIVDIRVRAGAPDYSAHFVCLSRILPKAPCSSGRWRELSLVCLTAGEDTEAAVKFYGPLSQSRGVKKIAGHHNI